MEELDFIQEQQAPLGGAHALCPVELRHANINPTTLLATDYLNHYNEVIMLFEMLPDMPDCLEDVEEWQPRSYVEHFQNSGFQGKALAIAAYRHTPASLRAHFESICAELDKCIIEAAVKARMLHEQGREAEFRDLCQNAHLRFSPLLDQLNGAIHGTLDESLPEPEETTLSDHDQTQADIDALFD